MIKLFNQFVDAGHHGLLQIWYDEQLQVFFRLQGQEFISAFDFVADFIVHDAAMPRYEREAIAREILDLRIKRGWVYGYFTKNGHCLYVGQTSQNDHQKRHQQHCDTASKFNELPFYKILPFIAFGALERRLICEVLYSCKKVLNNAENDHQKELGSVFNNRAANYLQCDKCKKQLPTIRALFEHLEAC